MKLSVIAPVKNEAMFIGYSVMAVLPYVHEILYGCAKSDDGTDEILGYIKGKYADQKLTVFRGPDYDFDPMDMKAYNKAYNNLIEIATGDAIIFLHPDMIITNPESIMKISESPLAWTVNMRSFAGDMKTEIVSGRAVKWKNIHRKQFGLHYYGGYGSINEDFYHRDITVDSYIHHQTNFKAYPFEVGDSGLNVNHYCELKDYRRRFEKMKLCLKTQHPEFDDNFIGKMAFRHPRVSLDTTDDRFGKFEFAPSIDPIPKVFDKYRQEFDSILGVAA